MTVSQINTTHDLILRAIYHCHVSKDLQKTYIKEVSPIVHWTVNKRLTLTPTSPLTLPPMVCIIFSRRSRSDFLLQTKATSSVSVCLKEQLHIKSYTSKNLEYPQSVYPSLLILQPDYWEISNKKMCCICNTFSSTSPWRETGAKVQTVNLSGNFCMQIRTAILTS